VCVELGFDSAEYAYAAMIAAAEAAIALGIIIAVFRRFGHIEGGQIREMKG